MKIHFESDDGTYKFLENLELGTNAANPHAIFIELPWPYGSTDLQLSTTWYYQECNLSRHSYYQPPERESGFHFS